MKRKIVQIDEEICDGCGECVPSCAEGAIQIIEGKARLVSDVYCDGLGACLGHCPQDAITVIEREADEFDEQAVHVWKKKLEMMQSPAVAPAFSGGCPGSRMMSFAPAEAPRKAANEAAPGRYSAQPSQLRQWPVQLHLLSPQASYFQDCELLIAADCVPFAMADFHDTLLRGRAVAIACPKLDDVSPYVNKLAAIFSANHIRRIVVAIMEVPCCRGLLMLVQQALAMSGKEIPLEVKTLSLQGQIKE